MLSTFMVSTWIASSLMPFFLLDAVPESAHSLRQIMARILETLPYTTITRLDCRFAHFPIASWKTALSFLPSLEVMHTSFSAGTNLFTALVLLTKKRRRAAKRTRPVLPPLRYIVLSATSETAMADVPRAVDAQQHLLCFLHARGNPVKTLQFNEQGTCLDIAEEALAVLPLLEIATIEWAKFDDIFGCILISTWMSASLYGIVISQIFEYFRLYPEDSKLRRSLVYTCLLLLTVDMVAQFANVYLPTVTFWVPLGVISTSIIGCIVDTFLINRFYGLSKNLWISLFLGACVALGLAGNIMLAVTIELFNSYSASKTLQRHEAAVATLIWTLMKLSSLTPDVLIAAALIWRLITIKSKSSFKNTKSLIQRLVIGTMQTGSATSIAALLVLIMFYSGNAASNMPGSFHNFLSPLYVLTLLYNLNLRKQDGLSGTRSGGRSTESRGRDNICMDGIHVHRSALISMDPPQNASRRLETENYGEAMKQDLAEIESYGAKKVDFQDV
ncbi:hypothetical protein C8R45DRAFT_1098295 [Mycena sanguinolenta]|nr:hypothetical protein C8R45DRAFT_1098295 [Mycena sanguinolenta]